MINVLAIDDEPLALQQLTAYIKKIPFFELKGQCQSALEARKTMSEQKIDAIFIDINMPDLNGMDFVRTLTSPPIIVFTTAYSEYAIDGYKVDAADYLLKPFGMDDFLRAADKVKKRYEFIQKIGTQPAEIASDDSDDALFLKTEHRVIRINISDISYIEGMSEYMKIHLLSQPKPVIVLLSMKRIEERLPKNSFMRVHRSYIINLKQIQEINKSRILLFGDISIPIGDLYKETLNNYISRKFLGK